MKRLCCSFLLCTALSFAGGVPLAVNGASEALVEPGWPVIISAFQTQESDAPPQLSVTGTSVVAPQLRKGDGTLAWTISPETTAAMAPGSYTVRADAGKPVTFEIRVPTVAEEWARRAERLMLFAEYAVLEGDRARALEYVDELLRADADSVAARLKKADLFETDGKLAEALRMLDEAEMIIRRSNPSHPPVMVRKRQTEILARMLGE